jgi:aspartyl/asparaginyl beta-hydroxylase (cupin superfamily)
LWSNAAAVAEMSDKMEAFFASVLGETCRILEEWAAKQGDAIILVNVATMRPGALLPLHTNFDPFSIRSHMGLIVPEGDTRLAVAGESRPWREGEWFSFDAAKPHSAWNMTDKDRVVLIVDSYRHDAPAEEIRLVHKTLLAHRMAEDKGSMGMSGGKFSLPREVKLRYAGPHEVVA